MWMKVKLSEWVVENVKGKEYVKWKNIWVRNGINYEYHEHASKQYNKALS